MGIEGTRWKGERDATGDRYRGAAPGDPGGHRHRRQRVQRRRHARAGASCQRRSGGTSGGAGIRLLPVRLVPVPVVLLRDLRPGPLGLGPGLVRGYLEVAGFEVIVAGEGGAALASARGSKPDLVVLDLGLPGRDGLDVARELRTSSNVPIIILTARGDESDRIVGLELGAD